MEATYSWASTFTFLFFFFLVIILVFPEDDFILSIIKLIASHFWVSVHGEKRKAVVLQTQGCSLSLVNQSILIHLFSQSLALFCA